MIQVLSDALIPVFACLLLGYLAGQRKVVDNKDVRSLITFVMSFALPCSLFLTIARTRRDLLAGQGMLACAVAIVFAIVYAASYFCSRKLSQDLSGDAAVLSLTLSFPNIAAIGLPLLQAVYGVKAGNIAAIGIATGAMTISPVTLAILESGTSAGQALTLATRVRNSMWRAVTRPVVWAPMLGILAALIKFNMPSYLDRSLTVMGAATAGAALFLTGLIVSAQRFALNARVVWAVLLKNFLQPALFLGVATLVGVPRDVTHAAVLMCAIPCGFFGLVFGKGFNVSPPTASPSLIASYVLGIFTLAGWIVLLSRLG